MQSPSTVTLFLHLFLLPFISCSYVHLSLDILPALTDEEKNEHDKFLEEFFSLIDSCLIDKYEAESPQHTRYIKFFKDYIENEKKWLNYQCHKHLLKPHLKSSELTTISQELVQILKQIEDQIPKVLTFTRILTNNLKPAFNELLQNVTGCNEAILKTEVASLMRKHNVTHWRIGKFC